MGSAGCGSRAAFGGGKGQPPCVTSSHVSWATASTSSSQCDTYRTVLRTQLWCLATNSASPSASQPSRLCSSSPSLVVLQCPAQRRPRQDHQAPRDRSVGHVPDGRGATGGFARACACACWAPPRLFLRSTHDSGLG